MAQRWVKAGWQLAFADGGVCYCSTVVQSRKAVAAHSSSKQLLPFGFAEQSACFVCMYVVADVFQPDEESYITVAYLYTHRL